MDSCITRCSKPLKFRLCFLLGCATTLILIGVSSVFLYYPNTEHQLDSVPGKAQRNVAISGFSRVNNPFSQVIETGRKTEKFPQGEQGKDQGSTTPGEEAEKIRHYQHERLQFEWNDETEIQASNFSKIVRNRLIHFDLKGAPPKVPYLKEVSVLDQFSFRSGRNDLMMFYFLTDNPIGQRSGNYWSTSGMGRYVSVDKEFAECDTDAWRIQSWGCEGDCWVRRISRFRRHPIGPNIWSR